MERTHVADANGLDFAGGREGLHLLPGLEVIPVVNYVSLTVGVRRELVVIS